MPTAIVKSTLRAPVTPCLAAIVLSAACSSPSVATVCEGVPLLKHFDGTWESGYCWGYQLEPFPTPVVDTSWGKVKSLYR
ncbi:MAG: hypothetical protein IT349_04680 [Candidatus Eisenbacteria bacterium]|nr:hypothetical protein [Candidatus Eisenbacteria bacterium]